MSLTWNPATTPTFTPSSAGCAVWVPELGVFIVVGSKPGFNAFVGSSPDGITFTEITTSGLVSSSCIALGSLCWSPELGLLLSTGNDHIGGSPTTNALWTSPDGITWTPRGIPTNLVALSSTSWSPDLGLFVVGSSGGTGPTHVIATSPDGIVWTTRTSPWDLVNSPKSGSAFQITWSPDLNLFVVAGETNGVAGNNIMTSPDGITWTQRACPFDGNFHLVQYVAWCVVQGLFVGVGAAGTGSCVITSPDGITWTQQVASGGGQGGVVQAGALVVSGDNPGSAIRQSTDGIDWSDYYSVAFASVGFAYSSDLNRVIAMQQAFTRIYYADPPPAPVTTYPTLNARFSI